MFEPEISVHVRRTGEQVKVSVIPSSTTYGEVHKEVCQRIKEPYPEDYYLAWNYREELYDDQLVEAHHLGGSFQMIMRTRRLIEYLAGIYRMNKLANNEPPTEVLATLTTAEEPTAASSTIEKPTVAPPVIEEPIIEENPEVRKSILGDVVQSAIAKIPRQDVQKYLHQVVGKGFDILLMGSPRVGKSTLINAILKKDHAEADGGRNRVTLAHGYYEYIETYTTTTDNNENIESVCSIRVWDSPGIEDWDSFNVGDYIKSILSKTNPICLIYCASPGAYAEIVHLHAIIEQCKALKLFVALVVTNMYASDEADFILTEIFQKVLATHSSLTLVEDHVYHYGNVGLCTQVNSTEYKVGDIIKPQEGVDELMIGIMQSLSEKKMLQWCFALMDNGPFWIRVQAKIWRWASSFKKLVGF